jgi:Papain family cysteine protease
MISGMWPFTYVQTWYLCWLLVALGSLLTALSLYFSKPDLDVDIYNPTSDSVSTLLPITPDYVKPSNPNYDPADDLADMKWTQHSNISLGSYTVPDNFSHFSFDVKGKRGGTYALTPVRNQGDCGSCFAFAILDCLADRLYIKTGSVFRKPLSVQDLICQPIYRGSSPLTCSDGGSIARVFQHLSEVGIVVEEAYPYNETYNSSREVTCQPELRHVSVTGPNSYIVYQRELSFIGSGSRGTVDPDVVQEIKKQLLYGGPVVGMMKFEYHSELRELLYLAMCNPVYYEETDSSKLRTQGYHAVVIVGYVHYNDQECWVVRNSWGQRSEFYYNGFFLIPAGRNVADIERYVCYAVPEVFYRNERVFFRDAPAFVHKWEQQLISDRIYTHWLYAAFVSGMWICGLVLLYIQRGGGHAAIMHTTEYELHAFLLIVFLVSWSYVIWETHYQIISNVAPVL